MKITCIDLKKYLAEFLGTALLVVFGCGTAMLTGSFLVPAAYVTATALAFGLVLAGLAYSIGNISGCHVNPAVSLGFFVAGKMSLKDLIFYVIAQFLGGFLGALILLIIFGKDCSFGANAVQQALYNSDGDPVLWKGLVVEIVLTFTFVFVILGVTSKTKNAATAGLVIGLTLTLVHLLGIMLTGTSVNPARSLAPAIFAGGDALKQVWIFIIGPLLGGALAALCYKALAKGVSKDE